MLRFIDFKRASTRLIALLLFFQVQGSFAQKHLKTTWYQWLNNTWTYDRQIRDVYNNQGFCDSSYQYDWSGNTWDLVSVQTHSYSLGQEVASNAYSWISATSSWSPSSQSTITHTTGGRYLQSVSNTWNGSQYVNGSKVIYTYDQHVFLIGVDYYYWNNNAWENNFAFSFTNNATGSPTLSISKQWNASTWTNNSRISSTYNGNQTIEDWETWNLNSWLLTSKRTSTRNSNNQLLSVLEQLYQGSNLVNHSLSSYSYSPSLITYVYQQWNTATSTWTNYSMAVDEFEGAATGIDETNKVNFSLYPSPAQDKLTLSGTEDLDVILLYDMQGRLVEKRSVSDSKIILDVSALQPGVYLISNEKGETLRFLKE